MEKNPSPFSPVHCRLAEDNIHLVVLEETAYFQRRRIFSAAWVLDQVPGYMYHNTEDFATNSTTDNRIRR